MERQYGMPFRGCVSAIPRHQVGLDAITSDSRDWLIDPATGRLVRRLGSVTVGDSPFEQNGLLPAKWGARCRQLFELRSDSLTDGYPTVAALYGLDSSKYGQLYYWNRNTGGDQGASYWTNSAYFVFKGTPDAGATKNVSLGSKKYVDAADGSPAETNLCSDVLNIINAAATSFANRIVMGYGGYVTAGHLDQLTLQASGFAASTIVIPPGKYTMTQLCEVIQSKLRGGDFGGGAVPPYRFSVAYDTGTSKVTISCIDDVGDPLPFTLKNDIAASGHSRSALSLLGYIMDGVTNVNSSQTATYARYDKRFWISWYNDANFLLKWQSAAVPFNSFFQQFGALLGMTTSVDVGGATTNQTGATKVTDFARTVLSDIASGYPLSQGAVGGGVGTTVGYAIAPLAFDATDAAMSRGVTEKARRVLAAGSRRAVRGGDWILFPNYNGTPCKWSGTWTDVMYGTPLEYTKQRLLPLGHFTPVWMPTITTPSATNNGDEPWNAVVGTTAQQDRFFISVLFKHRDGSYSAPLTPAAPTYSGSAGIGLVTLSYPVTASKSYSKITWENIPIGPADVVARILLRSPKVDAQVKETASPKELKVTAVIQNNTQTTYDDTAGNDGSLVDAPDVVRFDHKWPDSARYLGKSDQRYIAAYLKPNPAALQVCCFKPNSAGGTAINQADTGTYSGIEKAFAIRENADDGSKTYLLTRDGTTYASAPIRLDNAASTYTLDYLCEVLANTTNATTTTVIGGWRSSLVPGADGSAHVSKLRISQVRAQGYTVGATLTVTTGQSTANIAVGMLVQHFTTATGPPNSSSLPTSGIYVTAVSGQSVTLSAAPSGTIGTIGSPEYFVFGWDFGDTRAGEQRVYSNATPGLAFFTQAWVDGWGPRKRSLIFTGSDPGHAPNAIDNWYVKNERSVPSRIGYIMGVGSLLAGAIVPCSAGVAILRNIRAGKTGLDDDYRLEVMNESRGCISPYSIVEGNGWVGYLTRDGYVINDGERETVITGEVFNPAQRTGILANEIALSSAEAAADADGLSMQAMVADGKLYLSFRTTGSVPSFILVYNFSTNMASFGTDQVLQHDGKPFGWSAPLTLPYGAMCTVGGSPNRYFGSVEDNWSSIGDGHLEQFETGRFDLGRSVLYSLPNFVSVSQYSKILTPNGGQDFGQVCVGAYVITRYVPAGAKVASIAADNQSLTMDVPATGTGQTESVTFYGKRVRPVAYLAMDFCESLLKKSLQKLWAMLRRDGGTTYASGLTIGVSNSDTRDFISTMNTPQSLATFDAYARAVLECPQEARSPRNAVELIITDDGLGSVSEVWGVQAKVETLQSER